MMPEAIMIDPSDDRDGLRLGAQATPGRTVDCPRFDRTWGLDRAWGLDQT